jgi:hypothetical protein
VCVHPVQQGVLRERYIERYDVDAGDHDISDAQVGELYTALH